MKKVEIDANDIIVPEIVTKQEYSQNRIKYDTKYNTKELYSKFFLIERKQKSKIALSSYLFNFKEIFGVGEGVLIVADYQLSKDIFLFGTLENPLDTKSLLKVEFLRDSFYQNNILTFANWIKFFANAERNTFVITNDTNKFKEMIESQELGIYKFKFIKREDVEKINSTVRPVFIKEDKLSIYMPAIVCAIALFYILNMIGNNIIEADIKSSHQERQKKSQELIVTTQKLQNLKNSDYFKNKEYYMKLSERKIYTRASE